MKKILIILLLCSFGTVFAQSNARSRAYADSYMARCNYTDALYWNPAMLSEEGRTGFNFLLDMNNNVFDGDMNGLSGKTLSDNDKEDILDAIDNYMVGNIHNRIDFYVKTVNNRGYGIGLNTDVNIKVDKEFMKLALYGTDKNSYNFGNNALKVEGASYIDFTYGMGNFHLLELTGLDEHVEIPEINAGFAFSLLTGVAHAKTDKFSAVYTANAIDGLHLDSNADVKYSVGGLGMKLNYSMYSKFLQEKLNVAMGMDNIGGFINYFGYKKSEHRRWYMENVFLNNLEDDVIQDESESEDIDAYTYHLPLTYRLGACYDFNYLDLSLDYSHIWGNDFARGHNTYSFATNIKAWHLFHFQWGMKFYDGDADTETSYGLVFNRQTWQMGISVVSADAFFPSYGSKGMTFGFHTGIKL